MTLLLAIGGGAIAHDLRPVDGTLIPVPYAARSISSGTVLGPGDIGTTGVPASSPLLGVTPDPADVIGSTASGDLAAGELISAGRLADPAGRRPGYVTMPVTFADNDLGQFLAAGQVIDIVWTPGDLSGKPAEVVVRRATVDRIPTRADGIAGGTAVLLEVAEDDAVRLAAAMASGSLSVVRR